MLTAVSNSENYKEVPSSRALKTIEEYPETLLHFFPDGQFSEEDRDLLSRSIRYINLDDPSTHNAINKLSGYLEKIKKDLAAMKPKEATIPDGKTAMTKSDKPDKGC